jgi:hypothetical protein
LTLKHLKVHLKGGVARRKQEGGGVLNRSILTFALLELLGGTI